MMRIPARGSYRPIKGMLHRSRSTVVLVVNELIRG